jgi:hypothetical protein
VVVLAATQGNFGGHSIIIGIPFFSNYKFWYKKPILERRKKTSQSF